MILVPGSHTITAELSGYSFTSANVQVQTNFFSTAPKNVGHWPSALPRPPYSLPSGSTDRRTTAEALDGCMGGWQNGSGVPFAALNIDGWKTAHTTNEQGNYRRELSPRMHIIDPFKSSYGIPPRAAFVSAGQTTGLDFIAKKGDSSGER